MSDTSKRMVEFKFRNKTEEVKYVWVEPAAISLELESQTEYKLITRDTEFTIEYDSEKQFTFWTDNFFGFKLFKRATDKEDWTLDIDLDD